MRRPRKRGIGDPACGRSIGSPVGAALVLLTGMTWLDAAIDSSSAYPRWLVVAVGTLMAVVLLWLMAKILKWSLYLLVILVLVSGGAWAVVLWLG